MYQKFCGSGIFFLFLQKTFQFLQKTPTCSCQFFIFRGIAKRISSLACFPWVLITCLETSRRFGHFEGQNGQTTSPDSISKTWRVRFLDMSRCFAFFICLARSPTIEPHTAHLTRVNIGFVDSLARVLKVGKGPFKVSARLSCTLRR